MITSKKDYLYFLECDKIALRINRRKPKLLGDYIWKYERTLRKIEFYNNCKPKNPIKYLLKFKMSRLSKITGFQIGINCFDAGLSLAHIGPVIINGNSKIGKNCRIQTGVTLGATNGQTKAPVLGDNIFLGDGCKIIGDVYIADNVAIGANAVVVKNIEEECTTWGGVPAKKISNNSSDRNIVKATNIIDSYYKK